MLFISCEHIVLFFKFLIFLYFNLNIFFFMKLVFITLKNQTWKVIKLLVLLLLLLSTLYMYHTLNDISKSEIYCNTGFILLSEFLENIWNFQISFHSPRKRLEY